jgi:histidine ammonia-lyase
MIAEVTSAALMSENKQMAHPASVDSTPTSANQEDHVSMACHGARRLLRDDGKPLRHRRYRGDDGRAGHRVARPARHQPGAEGRVAALRTVVATLEEDRYIAPDLAAASSFVSSGALAASVTKGILPVLEA